MIDETRMAVDGAIYMACRLVNEVSTKSMMLACVGRTAISVGSPLKGMSREMVFVRSGLQLGIISPVNNPARHFEVSDGDARGAG